MSRTHKDRQSSVSALVEKRNRADRHDASTHAQTSEPPARRAFSAIFRSCRHRRAAGDEAIKRSVLRAAGPPRAGEPTDPCAKRSAHMSCAEEPAVSPTRIQNHEGWSRRLQPRAPGRGSGLRSVRRLPSSRILNASSVAPEMPNPKLRVALNDMPSSDWEFFEQFAAEFLVEDYPGLRTTASPHGDKGRDGEVFEIDDYPSHLVQYSLAADWDSKIKATVKRLRETKPELKVLIYATARRIGADADELKRTLRESGITLDVLDQSYFVERELTSPQRQVASEELIQRIVSPMLTERQIVKRVAGPLQSDEARVALLHLALDAKDETSEKNLTRACFESLVLAALHDSSAANPKSIDQIVATVQTYTPTENAQQVRGQTESALKRLSKKRGPVKHISKDGKYHLSFERQQSQANASAEFLINQNGIEAELVDFLRLDPESTAGIDLRSVGIAMRTGLESLLLRRGEHFANSLQLGEILELTPVEIDEMLVSLAGIGMDIDSDAVGLAVRSVLTNASETTRSHLQSLSDAYTMFAFLRQTPDVQKVANQLFTDSEIWLDTSLVLPLLAEIAETDRLRKPYSVLIEAAQASGVEFFVTSGVIEEVEAHIRNSRVYASGAFSAWRGRVPFLFTAYMMSGLPRSSFASWVEEFRSDSRPEEDVEEYLHDVFALKRRDLDEIASTAPQDLRSAVQEVWAKAHENRRTMRGEVVDTSTMLRLVSHDVDNCVGVIMTRKESPASPLGYRHWWLTLDRVAYGLNTALKVALGHRAPHSPVLDPAYLIRILRMNRTRAKISPDLRLSLPLLLESPVRTHRPEELIRIAEEIRAENSGKSERVIRRAIRDRMDELRTLKQSTMDAAERSFDDLGPLAEDLEDWS